MTNYRLNRSLRGARRPIVSSVLGIALALAIPAGNAIAADPAAAAPAAPVSVAKVEQREILMDDFPYAGSQDFDGNVAAIGQACKVDLSHRGAGDRRQIELREDFSDRSTVGALQTGQHQLRRKGRNTVL